MFWRAVAIGPVKIKFGGGVFCAQAYTFFQQVAIGNETARAPAGDACIAAGADGNLIHAYAGKIRGGHQQRVPIRTHWMCRGRHTIDTAMDLAAVQTLLGNGDILGAQTESGERRTGLRGGDARRNTTLGVVLHYQAVRYCVMVSGVDAEHASAAGQ